MCILLRNASGCPNIRNNWTWRDCVYINAQMLHAGVAVAVRKRAAFRLVASPRAVNRQVEAGPWLHPKLKQATEAFEGEIDFAALGLLRELWRVPDEEGKEAFIMVIQEGLISSQRMPPGLLDAAPLFQSAIDADVM